MSIFPTYESKGQLTTQTPAAPAVASTQGQQLEQVSKAGQSVQDASLKWINAVDTIQKTSALANFKTGALDITQKANQAMAAAQTPDELKKITLEHNQALEQLKQDNLQGFASKTAQTEASLSLGYETKVAQIGIDNLYKNKMIDAGQASTLQLIDGEINNPGPHSLSNIQKVLNAQVQAGIFDHKAAYEVLQRANKELGVNRVNKDLYQAQTPEQVDAVTQGLTSGGYEQGGVTIEPDKKKALLDIADRAKINTEKKLQAQATEAIAQNRATAVVGVLTGKINPQTMNISDISNYDPKLGSALTIVKDFMTNYNPKVPAAEQTVSMNGMLTKAERKKTNAYAKSITDVFNHDNNEELGNFMLRELETKGDGNNSSVKLAAFMQLAALKMKANNPQTAEDMKAAEQINSVKSGISFLQASNPYLAAKAIGDFVVSNFHSKNISKKAVMQEARTALEDQIFDRYKAVTKLSSLPNKIVDGEASVEDLQSGVNELDSGDVSSDYSNVE